MKPIIGIVGRPDTLKSGREVYYINREINEAIIKNNATAITILPNMSEKFANKDISNTRQMTDKEFEDLKKVIDICDGIICQGGDQFYDYDLKIINYCYKVNKPLLGICLGMQAMAYLFDGKLVNLPNLNHKNDNDYVHDINIKKDSKLYQILKREFIKVNSRHIQCIINTNLDVVAVSSDNIIEAVEDKNKLFFIGLQWHPESMIEYDILENKIFEYFIKCCGR